MRTFLLVFSRASFHSAGQQAKGTGLSLSYDIVTKGHGGTMEVKSVEGEGTLFTVTLINQ